MFSDSPNSLCKFDLGGPVICEPPLPEKIQLILRLAGFSGPTFLQPVGAEGSMKRGCLIDDIRKLRNLDILILKQVHTSDEMILVVRIVIIIRFPLVELWFVMK